MRTILSLSLALILFSLSHAQQDKLRILKPISQVEPSSSTGLTQTFQGTVADDGSLYFLASEDAFHKSYWKTDGSPENTVKIFDEESFNNWSYSHFIPEGIITLKSRPDLRVEFFDAVKNETIELMSLPDGEILEIMDIGSSYLIFTEFAGLVDIYNTDLTAEGTIFLSALGENDFNTKITGSEFGAILTSKSSNSDFVTYIYNNISKERSPLFEFFSRFKNISEVEYAYMYDRYIFTQVVEDGSLNQLCI